MTRRQVLDQLHDLIADIRALLAISHKIDTTQAATDRFNAAKPNNQ